MTRESTLLAGRRFNEDSLTDRITVQRRTGYVVQDETSGHEDYELETLYTNVPAKIQVGALGSLIPTARERQEAGREITTTRTILKVAVDDKVYKADDIVTLTSVGDLSDMQLLGSTFQVVAPVAGSYQTTRRFAIEATIS